MSPLERPGVPCRVAGSSFHVLQLSCLLEPRIVPEFPPRDVIQRPEILTLRKYYSYRTAAWQIQSHNMYVSISKPMNRRPSFCQSAFGRIAYTFTGGILHLAFPWELMSCYASKKDHVHNSSIRRHLRDIPKFFWQKLVTESNCRQFPFCVVKKYPNAHCRNYLRYLNCICARPSVLRQSQRSDISRTRSTPHSTKKKHK